MKSKKLKVLFLTYPRIGLNRGGLQIQIEKTAKALSKLGVEVVFYDPWKNQLPDVDLCHVFSIEGTLIYHTQRAVELGKPVIISPVFNNFTRSSWQTAIKVRLGRWVPGMYINLERSNVMISRSDRVLPLNAQEQDLLLKSFDLQSENCTIVPNGIAQEFSFANPKLFEDQFGVKDFILNVGSIEHRKNQLNLIKSMSNVPYTLIIIGEASSANQPYLRKCKENAGNNVIFVGQLNNDNPLLMSAFSAAKLFILPSYSEVMPLTLYEAAVSGCKLSTSKNVPVSPIIKQFIPQFDPNKPDEISAIIKKEMELPINEKLTHLARTMPSWEDVGVQIKDIYEDILYKNPPRIEPCEE